MEDEMWVKIQLKTFTRWANDYLSKRGLKIDNLKTDLCDGFLLHQLLEVLSGETLPKVMRNAKFKIQKVENLNVSLNFIKEKQIVLQNIGGEDIYGENLKLILGLIWTLIIRFQIDVGDEDPGGTKSALLEWVNRQIVPQGLRVYDFKGSWSDGKAFCGLVNALQPGTINLAECTDPKESMEKAFKAAHELFKIPKILDADDVINHPDDLSIMTYVAYFKAYQNQNTAFAPNCTAEGPGLSGTTQFEPGRFVVTCRSEENEEATRGGAPVRAKLVDANGKEVCPVIVKDLGNGKYDCHYIPPISGDFDLHVTVKNQPIKGSAWKTHVKPGEPHASSCEAFGEGTTQAKAGVPTSFTIVAKDQQGKQMPKGGATFLASLTSPDQKTIPVTIVDNGDGTYTGTYIPQVAGPSKLLVECLTKAGKGTIKNAPFYVNVQAGEVDYENFDLLLGQLGHDGATVIAGEERKFIIQSKDKFGNPQTVGGVKVTAKLTPEKGNHVPPVTITDLKDGTYEVKHTIEKAGPYKLDIFAGPTQRNIGNSKVLCIPDRNNPSGPHSIASGDGISKAKVGEPNEFTIQAKDRFDNVIDRGGAKIGGVVRGPDGKTTPIKSIDNGDGTYLCSYPDIIKDGVYTVEPTINNELVKDAPFKVTVDAGEVDFENFDLFWNRPGEENLDGQVVVAGEEKKFVIHAKDKHGNKVKTGGLKIAGKLIGATSPPVTVIDNKDGSYEIKYTIEKTGPYKLALTGGPNNKEIGSTKVTCIPATPIGVNSIASGDGITKPRIGEPNNFKIQAKDKFDNDVKDGGAKVECTLKGPNGKLVPVKVVDNKDGTYACSYPDIAEAGDYVLEPKLNGTLVKNAPFHIHVGAGEVDFENFDLTWARPDPNLGHDGRIVVAGEEKTFTIQARDKQGNPCKFPTKLEITGGLTPTGGQNLDQKPKFDVKDLGNGLYEIKFVCEKTGPYKLNLAANHRPIGESKVTCIPAAACGKTSTASGKGLHAATIGAPNEFVVQARDQFGNDIKKGGDKIEGFVKSPTGKLVPIKSVDKGDGTYVCTYPDINEDGIHFLEPKLNGELIKNAPFKLEIDPKPMAIYNGPRPFQAIANRASKIPLDVVNLSPKDLDVTIVGPNGKTIPHKIVDNGNGTFDVVFTPTDPGKTNCTMAIGKDKLEPIAINVQETPSATLVGPASGKFEAFATKPFTFSLDTVNLKPDALKVEITDKIGRPFNGPVEIKDNGDGTMDVTFCPLNPGPLKVNLRADGDQVKGAPFDLDVQEKPWASYNGPRPVQANANRETHVTLDVINLKPEDLHVSVNDLKTNKPIPHKIKDNKNGTFDLVFTPTEIGAHEIKLSVDKEPIKPIPVNVNPTPSAVYRGPMPFKAIQNRESRIPLDVVNLKPNEVEVQIVDPNTRRTIPHKIKDNGDGTFDIVFTPNQPGNYLAKIAADGDKLPDVPVVVEDQPSAKYLGPKGKISGQVNQPVRIPLATTNLRPNDLEVDVVDSDGNRVPTKILDNGDGTFNLEFVPTNPVPHKISGKVKADGLPIEGFPLTADIAAEPWAKIKGVPPNHCKVGEPYTLKLDSKNLKPSDLEVVVPEGKLAGQPKIKDNGDGTFSVTVVPNKEGELPINVLIDGKPIQGCPLKIQVDKKTVFGADLLGLLDEIASEFEHFTLVPYSDLENISINKPVLFNIVPDEGFTPVSTSTAFEATCHLKSNPKITAPCLIRETPDKRIEVRFVPQVKDTYVLDVKQSNHSIKDSPQEVYLSPIALEKPSVETSSMKISVQVEEKTSVVNTPFKFLIIFSDVDDPRLIKAKVTDPTGKELPLQYAPQYSSGNIEVLLTPENAGSHKINIFFEGSPVSGTSQFQTSPMPYSCITGEQARNDGISGGEYLVQMTAIASKISDFKFAVKGPATNGHKGPPTVVASLGLDPSKDQGIRVKFTKDGQPANPNGTENGVWDIRFHTKFSGDYTLLVFHNSKPVQGCPVTITCPPDGASVHSGGSQRVTLCSEVDQDKVGGTTSPRGVIKGSTPTTSPRTGSGSPVQIHAKSSPRNVDTPTSAGSSPQGSSRGPVQISAKPSGGLTSSSGGGKVEIKNSNGDLDKPHSSRKDKSDKTSSKSSSSKKSSTDKSSRSHRDKSEKAEKK